MFTVNGTNRSFSTFEEDIVDSTTVYNWGIAVYVIIGMFSVLVDRAMYIKHNRKKKWLKKLKCITDWRWQSTLVLVVGVLYLAGDNLDLVIPLDHDIVLDERTQIKYADLRSYLLGISLVLGLVLIVPKLYGGGSVAKKGLKRTELVDAADMVVSKLFPMLIFTVQLDQIYTTIAGQVVHQRDDLKDGTLCPRNYVIGGIIFFVVVWVIWIAVVCFVIGKHIYTLFSFKENKGYSISTIDKHVMTLVVWWYLLILYTPAYIALGSKWPWICAAKCRVQEVCNINPEELCTYVKSRSSLLFALSVITLVLAVYYYERWTKREANARKRDANTEDPGAQQKSAKDANKA